MRVKQRLLTTLSLILLLLMAYPTVQLRATTERPVENLVAFTKLLGYVRYFHPADSAKFVDWDSFAASHVETIMTIEDDATLINILNELFTPYAPTIQIYLTGETPELPADLIWSHDKEAIVQWVHIPVDDMLNIANPVIPSEYATIALENDVLPATFEHQVDGGFVIALPVHNPAEPYIASLSDTIEASIPLALYRDAEGTLPHVDSPSIEIMTFTGDDLNGRLTSVMYTWNFFQHFFSYWDVLENSLAVDWDAALEEALSNAISDENAADFWLTLSRLTAYLNDGHVYLYPSPEARNQLSEEYLGGNYRLPFTWDLVEGELTVTTVSANAEDIHLGDVIAEINGQPVMERLAEWREITSLYGAFGDYYILLGWATGQRDSTLTLSIEPFSGEDPYTMDVVRSARTGQVPSNQHESRPEVIADLGSNILYVDLTRLSETRYEAAIEQMANAEGLVFDMRGYPTDTAWDILGHLRGTSLSSAPFLVPITVTPDHLNMQFIDVTSDTWVLGKNPVFTDNVAFIINSNGAVSFAESIMGIVEGYELGEIIGTPTAGTNGNVALLNLPAGYSVSFTSLHVTRFDDSPLFTVGIQPTIPIERTRAGVGAGRDELLEIAFETLAAP